MPKGYNFCLTWTFDKGAVGYHIFRSQSVRHIRDRSMHSLWSGAYGDSITHFVVSKQVDTIIDNYRLRNAQLMFYWVLSQDSAGNLRSVENLQVRMADDFARARKHFVLEYTPGAPAPPSLPTRQHPPPHRIPTAPPGRHTTRPHPPVPATQPMKQVSPMWDPRTQPPAAAQHPPQRPPPSQPHNVTVAPAAAGQPQQMRQVFFITYTAPGLFQIRKEGHVADHYQVYIGPAVPPNAAMADAMWDGNLLPGNPMRCYTLPGHVEGFRDAYSPAGQNTFMAIFALLNDGTRTQPNVVIPPSPPAVLAELT